MRRAEAVGVNVEKAPSEAVVRQGSTLTWRLDFATRNLA